MIEAKYTMGMMLFASVLWIGFVGAISFMEAWLKFRAPGVSLSVGLGIGRVVFDALNKVEWALAAILLIALILEGGMPKMEQWFWWAIPMTVLLVQTFWLLPGLDLRAQAQMQGNPPEASGLHWYYVAGELLKVIGLFVFSITLFQWPRTP